MLDLSLCGGLQEGQEGYQNQPFMIYTLGSMSKRVVIYAEVVERKIRAAGRQGKGIKKIARELGIGVSTVQRVVHEPSP